MNPAVYEWAARHSISGAALFELKAIFGTVSTEVRQELVESKSERYTQSKVRLAAAEAGWLLCRNNVGVLEDKRGVPVRYGLANESKQMNEEVKSGDLIGARPVIILPHMVGHTIGQFVSREMKPEDWTYTGTDHERAQLKWIELCTSVGADAKFSTGDL